MNINRMKELAGMQVQEGFSGVTIENLEDVAHDIANNAEEVEMVISGLGDDGEITASVDVEVNAKRHQGYQGSREEPAEPSGYVVEIGNFEINNVEGSNDEDFVREQLEEFFRSYESAEQLENAVNNFSNEYGNDY